MEISDTPSSPPSEAKVCKDCNTEILPGEGYASHEGQYWHYGECGKPRIVGMPSALGMGFGIGRGPERDVYEQAVEKIYSPPHYTQGYLETIYVIQQILGVEGFKAFCMGNYIKYKERHSYKNGAEDLKKAEQYLEWATNGLPKPVNGRVPR